MRKKILIISLFALTLLGIISHSDSAKASLPTHTLYGWAWSSNIGWVSFDASTANSGVDYGVDIELNTSSPNYGNLSGYAWSSNIGWISFNSAHTSNCPIAPCQAKLTGNDFQGWAKALAADDNGWDGWISLKGKATNGADYGIFRDGNALKGFAWGDDVVGWLNYNPAFGGVFLNISAIPPPAFPTAVLSANPSSVSSGQSSTLSWFSTHATSCIGTNFSTGGATSGSVSTGALTSTKIYSVSCTGTGGTAYATTTVAVTGTPPSTPPTLTGACNASPAEADVNETIVFTASANGGTGEYSYSWTGDSGISGSASSIQNSYSTAGTKVATVNITSGSQSISRTCSVAVFALAPATGCIAIHKEVYDEHDTAITPVPTFSFKIDGVSDSTVYNDNTGIVNVFGLSVGNHTVSETTPSGWTMTSVVPDGGAVSVSAGNSCADVVFKNKQDAAAVPDIAGSCSANPSVAYTGDNVTYTASATGGDGTFTYLWNFDDGLSATTKDVQAVYSSVGIKNAHVTISSGGKSVTKDCGSLIVEHDQPLNGSCSATPSTAKTGENITYTASATGGTTTVAYTYNWGGDDGISGSNASVQKTYATAGNKSATVDITAGTETISRSCSAVITEPVVNQTGCIVIKKEAYNSNNVLIAQTPAFIFTVDGTGSYTTNIAGAVQISNLSVGDHVVAENPITGWTLTGTVPELVAGHVNVSAGASCSFVTFKNKQIASTTTIPALIGSCSASPSTVHRGNPITFTALASGGTGNYSYSWTGEPNLTGFGTSTQVSYSATGTKTMMVNISSGTSSISANCSATVTEANVAIPFTLTCSPNTASATTGSTITFTANASGGNGVYQYSWSGDDSLAGTSATTNHTYTSAGTKNATITATSSGQVLTAQCSLQVNNPSINVGGGYVPPSGGGTNWGYQISTTPAPTPSPAVSPAPAPAPVPQVAGVFLSQVPYTGIGDNLKVMFFIFGLFAWSIWIAYILVKRKSRTLAFVGIVSSENTETESVVAADPRLDILRSNKNELMEVLEYRAREQRAIISAPALEMIMKRATQQSHTALSMLDSAIAIYTKGRDESERDWTTISTEKITAVLQSL